MVDFRVSFEEEKVGGFLLLFFAMLIAFEIPCGIIELVAVNKVVKYINMVNIIILVLGILYIASTLFTAISVYKIQKYIIKISKVYLIVRSIFLTICFTTVYFNDFFRYRETFGNPKYEYKSLTHSIMQGLVSNLVYVLVFSALWYLYFARSKQCQQLGSQKKTGFRV